MQEERKKKDNKYSVTTLVKKNHSRLVVSTV